MKLTRLLSSSRSRSCFRKCSLLYKIIFSFLALATFCEFCIYYVVIFQCSWPVQDLESTSPQNETLRAMFLADTHLLGPFKGHWFDKLRREWQMYRAFQTALTIFSPEAVFFLECDEDEDAGEEEEKESLDEEEVEMRSAEARERRAELENRYIRLQEELREERRRGAILEDKLYRVLPPIKVKKQMKTENMVNNKYKKKSKKKHRKPKPRKESDAFSENSADIETNDEKKKKKKEKKDKRKKVKAGEETFNYREKFRILFSARVQYQNSLVGFKEIEDEGNDCKLNHKKEMERLIALRAEMKKVHDEKLEEFLDAMREVSREAVDPNSGRLMSRAQTEVFCQRLAIIHRNVYNRMVQMYKARAMNDLSLLTLEEIEGTEGGPPMIQFEQLFAENRVLGYKLIDITRDVDDAQAKATAGIQILAHLRTKMVKLTEELNDGENQLETLNSNLYSHRDKTAEIVDQLKIIKRTMHGLMMKSKLWDHPVMLSDFEKTRDAMSALKIGNTKLKREIESLGHKRTRLLTRIMEIENVHPEVIQLLPKRKISAREPNLQLQ